MFPVAGNEDWMQEGLQMITARAIVKRTRSTAPGDGHHGEKESRSPMHNFIGESI